jgi:hypothetical protein
VQGADLRSSRFLIEATFDPLNARNDGQSGSVEQQIAKRWKEEEYRGDFRPIGKRLVFYISEHIVPETVDWRGISLFALSERILQRCDLETVLVATKIRDLWYSMEQLPC